MTGYVLDANVLMGMLISGRAGYRPLLEYYQFVLPEYALAEVDLYCDKLKSKTKMDEGQFFQWTYFVFSQVTILPRYSLSNESLRRATKLLKSIDQKDIPYVATAMQLDLALLSRDKPLHNGLRKKGFRKIILFEDFLRRI